MSVDELFNNGLRIHGVESEGIATLVAVGVGVLVLLMIWLMDRKNGGKKK